MLQRGVTAFEEILHGAILCSAADRASVAVGRITVGVRHRALAEPRRHLTAGRWHRRVVAAAVRSSSGPIALYRSSSASADNPVGGSPEPDGDTRNGGPLRKRSCRGGGSCRRSAHNDRANDERTDHHGHDDNIDNDQHGSDHDEHGDDDHSCGDHNGAADLDNYRLITASADDSYSRSPSWGERV